MASEPRIVRMRLMRRRRGSCAAPAASARPIASPICSTRESMPGVIAYGGLAVMVPAARKTTAQSFHPSGAIVQQPGPVVAHGGSRPDGVT